MQIQPIAPYSANYTCKPKNVKSKDEPLTQPNQPCFKGIKGFVKGGATGAGITIAGVSLVAGISAIPLFLSYVAVNGIIAAATGHIVENKNKSGDKK